MPKRLVLILASVVLASVAVFLIKVYLDRQKEFITEQTKQEVAMKQQSQISVLVAARDMPKGTTIEIGMLQEQIITREAVQPQAVTDPNRIIGMITLVSLSRGEQITLNKLISTKEAVGTDSSLAMATPMGKRAITISVDNIASLVGMIRPGDYVDVVAAVNMPMQTPEGQQIQQPAVLPLFQNVLVLAMGREMGTLSGPAARYKKAEAEGPAEPPLITLALAPQEANLIAFVQEQGRIRLILRSPADSLVEPIQPASWDTLFQYIMANSQPIGASPEQAGQPKLPEKGRDIEIYRGLKKEVITLSK